LYLLDSFVGLVVDAGVCVDPEVGTVVEELVVAVGFFVVAALGLGVGDAVVDALVLDFVVEVIVAGDG
jgi:hypothetical protein